MHLFPVKIMEYPNGTKISIYNTNFRSIFGSNREILEVTRLTQINGSLQKGPVFLNIGAIRCLPCQKMNPILSELAKKYKGNVTFMYIDKDKSPDLTEYFRVEYIPESFVVVDIENKEYVYMLEDGNISKDRSNAKILGFRSKQDLEKVLDVTIQKKNAKLSKEKLNPKTMTFLSLTNLFENHNQCL